ncbi:MAG: DUF885 family protein [Proteobacteria bacterium]|nr:DUF885 family protein [Pseudomonadota bacterium]
MDTTRRAVLTATAAGLAILASGCNQTGGAAGGDAQLNALLDRISTQFLHEAPESATSLAVTEQKAGGRFKDRLSDASKEGSHRRLQLSQQAVADLQHLGRDSLSNAGKVSYDVVITALQQGNAASAFDYGGGATAPYVLSQLTGSYANLPDFLASQHTVASRDDADAYLARLSGYAHVLDQEIAVLNADAAAGVIPPNFSIERPPEQGEHGNKGAIPQLRGFIAGPAAQNVLVASFVQKLGSVDSISAADKNTLAQHAQTIVHDEIYPAYQRQIDALNALKPRATHDAGIWKLPHGEEMYAAALAEQTTTSMSPDEIHRMGLELCQSLTAEMDTIFKAQGMSRGTVSERIQQLFSRPDQMFPNTDAGRDQILAYCNQLVAQVMAVMPQYFGAQAHAALQIKRVPAYTQDGAPGGYYQNAALDGSRPGAYYINLRDTSELPKFTLPTLTHHEGVPGHHWQISIAQEQRALPFIRSALLGFNAYAEGWALYAEQLSDEIGLYANDPWGRIGYLKDAAMRASRLVVDSGIHAKRWTREQAITQMQGVTGDKRSAVVTEIERYCVWPGQACGYMVGRQAINRMRDSARSTLGQRFDIKGFHDAVLVNGSTPLSVTESLVNEWVASRQHG